MYRRIIFSGLTLVQQVEFLAGLEPDRFAGRDANLGAGSGVAANTRFARLDGEDAESAQLNAVAAAKGGLHGLENDVYRSFSLSARETRTLDYPLNQILLDHGAYLFLWRASQVRQTPACGYSLFPMVERGISVVNAGVAGFEAPATGFAVSM